MPRYFAPITEDDLRDKIWEQGSAYGDITQVPHIEKDLSKCSWDTENHDSWMETLPNGMVYEAHSAGGDWESPVYFIIYWDGKKLRGYIPTDGNPWNRTTKMAFGNPEEYSARVKDDQPWDGIAMIKQYPELYKGEDPACLDGCDVDRDDAKIKEDIMSRILPKPKPGSQPKKTRRLSAAEYARKKGTVCPLCRNDQIQAPGTAVDRVESELHIKMHCPNCHATWTDVFVLHSYRDLEKNDGPDKT